ncbi:MAG: hypothetical protein Fur0010_04300 [Bdellovibrio sp.]
METGIKTSKKPKLLDNNVFNGVAIPVAIVLVGALIIFGVTKILSSERNYKDLVREVQSKTFGNRWVAAFELAKILSANRIPESEIPWLIENLNEVYQSKPDPRTREFIIVSLASIKHPKVSDILFEAVKDESDIIKFRAVMGLGNQSDITSPKWSDVEQYLTSSDYALRQASALTLMTHRVSSAEPKVVHLLSDQERVVRYSAALGLINFKNDKALDLLKEILVLSPSNEGFDQREVSGLKLSLIGALRKNQWNVLNAELAKQSEVEPDIQVKAAMQEALIQLKN